MPYKVIVEKTAAKAIEKMDAGPRKQILGFLKELAQSGNPRNEFDGKALQHDRRIWRFRVGVYRIIADIDDKIVTITIIKVGHRGKIYRSL